MPAAKPTGSKMWTGSLERPVFDISENQPIVAFHHNWSEKQELRYDMHYGLELGVMLRGKMRRDFGTCSFDVSIGDVWMCGMWEPHGYQITSVPCEAIVMIIFPPVLTYAGPGLNRSLRLLAPFEVDPQLRPKVLPEQKETITTLAESMKKVIYGRHQNKDMWLSLRMAELLLILLESWEQPESEKQNTLAPTHRINRAIRLVFENDRFVSTHEAARACGINRNSFAKQFRDAMGISFSEFALRYRVRAAAEMLMNTEKPVKTIAAELGFTDTSHLYRCFNTYYKCSPTEYRLLNVLDI